MSQKCRWTDMLPLHYAVFFDAAPIMRVLLKASNAKGLKLGCYASWWNFSPHYLILEKALGTVRTERVKVRGRKDM